MKTAAELAPDSTLPLLAHLAFIHQGLVMSPMRGQVECDAGCPYCALVQLTTQENWFYRRAVSE
jgi:hypothetical protein